MTTKPRRTMLLLYFSSLLLLIDLCFCFTIDIRSTRRVASRAAPPLRETFQMSEEVAQVKDANGKVFEIGCDVRVVADNMKAFQVSPKGRGYFNDQKEFVPVEEGPPSKYLLLPVGLRGTVTKVYNVDEISANFPVQVKFTPGSGGDYDPPVTFLMHFECDEIECV